MSDRIISDERWEVNNADFARIMMRIRERDRQAKMAVLQPKDTKPEPEPKYLRYIGIGLVLFTSALITVQMILWVVR